MVLLNVSLPDTNLIMKSSIMWILCLKALFGNHEITVHVFWQTFLQPSAGEIFCNPPGKQTLGDLEVL